MQHMPTNQSQGGTWGFDKQHVRGDQRQGQRQDASLHAISETLSEEERVQARFAMAMAACALRAQLSCPQLPRFFAPPRPSPAPLRFFTNSQSFRLIIDANRSLKEPRFALLDRSEVGSVAEDETSSEEGEEERGARQWDEASITSAQESYGEVNKIIASRAIDNRMFYLIEWKDGHEPSWLPASSIAKDVLAEYETPWWKAAKTVDDQKLSELLADEGRDVDTVDENGRTALLFASGMGSVKCVRLLLEAGADVDGQDLEGFTPLHMATGYAKQNIVTTLLEFGADPEIEDSKGRTPLTLAQELIEKTPKANPLQFARRLAFENIVKQLENELYDTVEVEQVLDKRSTNGSIEYFVKWKDGSENDWVPAENVADDLIQDYEAGLEYGIAEKILERKDENGQVEYLVKWADIEKPTWEPIENVASELVAEFENISTKEVEKMLQKSLKTS